MTTDQHSHTPGREPLAQSAEEALHSADEALHEEKVSMLRQPKAVWATALAAVFAFMGIGLVDPILPAIAVNLEATPSQVSLLFTSYFAITGVAMLVTGWLSSRIGGKPTLIIGLGLVVLFASLSGTADSVGALVGFRAGWGLGNALFVATALAVIIGVASGGSAVAIILYEAALGLGISLGPLLGAALGSWNWRAPFFGTAALMLLALIALVILLPRGEKPAVRTRLRDPLVALGHGGLRTTALGALCYYFGFFTILAFTPFILGMGAGGIGLVFFGWGVMLAVCSVFAAPVLQRIFGTQRVLLTSLALFVALLVVVGLVHTSVPAVIVLVIVAGALIGVNNTLFTELAMGVSDAPRPVASAGYNFVRWIGGAAAPFFAPRIAEALGPQWAYFLGAAVVAIGVGILAAGRRHFAHLEH